MANENNGTDLITEKKVLTSSEAAQYLGISMSYLYKLTMTRAIPHYKPTGKLCYFDREELEAWLHSNRVATADELENQAQAYCKRGSATAPKPRTLNL